MSGTAETYRPTAASYDAVKKPKLSTSLIGAKGLCAKGRKCIRKDGHDGRCYPDGD